ncbi:mediator of RNA polymerase II transcription subunit 17 [Cucurbitaria berberidis CBS 394.84]|uniref:Mediator of RNA polymerase II transcription subunit 17 n=1 Tax=Cucurbitaria berberidis CBS 394.84 TaxID=1168544 RepID=A0A9P4L5D4_9PLEO|nr:mediator of RNA polymerase II transcription subunit 17 [Cucurbitaria berberidis CBS 394.84]KAF1842510.1 mediator of RNA polymerase II transcription subunit 17 [Cucurbitaria berberidis CBS 394.84]
MAGTESLRDVTLRPWPAPKKEELSQEDLFLQIQQLTTERGHLRDITEKSLHEDIAAGKDVPDEAKEDVESGAKEKDAPTKQEMLEKVFNAQREMYGHLEWAKFAAENALDLISLVLSQDPNKRSAASFSHTFREMGLSQGIPFGSFGISRENHEFHVRKPDEILRLQEQEDRQVVAAKGSRMESLDSAVDEILKAAKKLEKEVRRETKYWKEIVSVSDKGWPIQRLRQNARHVPFGVRYGLPEASDHFKARGFAPLNMDKDGSIILDPALRLKPKTFRVRISENGRIIGTSQLPIEAECKELPIEKSIQLARDSLLEEELYHEMSLETRQLLAYGVEFRDSVIHVDAPRMGGTSHSRKLLIDCIPRDDSVPGGQERSHDWLAQNVAEALRLLLAHEHSMRLYRRSQLPPPLTGRAREKPPPPLLRTLLAVFRHLEGVGSLHVYLETVARTLNSAGLDVTLTTTLETSWAKLTESLKESSKKGLSATDQLLDVFMKPFDGRATLTLPSWSGQSESMTIATRTIVGQPTFGTEHKLTMPSSLTSDLGLFQELKFSVVEEVKSYIDWILTLQIAHRLVKSEYSSRVVIKTHGQRVTIVSRGTKKGSTASKDISVEVQHGELKVTATAVNPQEGAEDSERVHTWNGQKEAISLKEVVKSWVE